MTKRLPRLHLSTPHLEEAAQLAREQGVLRDEELLIVDALAPRYGETRPMALLGLAFALRAVRVGHAGVHLRGLGEVLNDETQREKSDPPKRADELGGEEAPVTLVGGSDEGEESEEGELQGEVDEPLDEATPAGRLRAVGLPHTAKTLAEWESTVLASPLVSADTATLTPFHKQARDDGSWLLLTQRMAREQERLALGLKTIAAATPSFEIESAPLERRLATMIEYDKKRVPRRDKEGLGVDAVRRAVKGCLSIITGGPGTGKTYSIKRLVALLLDANREAGGPPLRIELAAPTGKAAVRMQEALLEDLQLLQCSEESKVALRSLVARTVHKLLGIRPDGTSRHSASLPLPADVVIVDEASMVGLALMRRLVESVGAGARLVLLGDRDQLASVDAGTVLADLVHAGNTGVKNPLLPWVTRFTESHRFTKDSGVGIVAKALQEGTPASKARAISVLLGSDVEVADKGNIVHHGTPNNGVPTKAQLVALAAPYLAENTGYAWKLGALLKGHGQYADTLSEAGTQTELLELLDNYRVLAVHRRGALGVAGLLKGLSARVREHLEAELKERAKSPPPKGNEEAQNSTAGLRTLGGYWLGEPVLITRNDYELDLRNGDIGLVLPDPNGRLCVVFKKGADEAKQSVDAKESGDAKAEATSTAKAKTKAKREAKAPDAGEAKGKKVALTRIALERLPANMGALAMTVHKAQGSQFQRIALVLAGHDSPIQTRELVYTALTRAKTQLDWLGSEEVLGKALGREVNRTSGLRELLRG